ncbi:uncharacterized protein LOC117202511 isoform X2 [Orcinus orca]|uniref:uncharacterized protein LOC117202511 isoform X2 n=1 Tax=Orcinus orca TaxID=9733 RepID=UPI0021112349|nr:uncharacterized protein LOC117202511 isoform X2 [Orcinus orca]
MTVLPPCVSSAPLCGVGRSQAQGPWRVNNNQNNFKFTDILCNQHQPLHQENRTLYCWLLQNIEQSSVCYTLPLTRNSSTWRRIASVTQSVDRSFSDQNPNPLPDGRPRISALVLGRPEWGRPLACDQWAPRRHPSRPFQPLEVGAPVDTGSTTVHCDRCSRAPCPPGAPSSDTSSVPLGARPCRLLRPGGRSRSLFHGSFKRKARRPFPFHLLNDLIHEGLGHHGSQHGPVPGSHGTAPTAPSSALGPSRSRAAGPWGTLGPSRSRAAGPWGTPGRGTEAGRGGQQSVSDRSMQLTCEVTPTVMGSNPP